MTSPREYRYVGSKELRESLPENSERVCIASPDDILHWIRATNQRISPDGTLVVTFIVDTSSHLWINHRQTEHVLCAGGQNVLSAGEMTFVISGQSVEVIGVTNQSTGYCPEPESWWAVENTLEKIGLPHPTDFTTAYLFRRCDTCGTINIVKDMWFECAVCQSPLSQHWNFQDASS